MYVTTHYVESVLEEVFDGVEIMEVAVDDLCSTTESTDIIQGLEDGFCAGFWGSVYEANGSAGLSESDGRVGTDAWRRGYSGEDMRKKKNL